jgi:hypothetical protein
VVEADWAAEGDVVEAAAAGLDPGGMELVGTVAVADEGAGIEGADAVAKSPVDESAGPGEPVPCICVSWDAGDDPRALGAPVAATARARTESLTISSAVVPPSRS